jgi:hypothetical protein
MALDSGDLAVLTLLDLLAAFDTVGHNMLLRQLSTSYGLTGSVIEWFASYLSGRHQYVHSGATTSSLSAVMCGVPQVSVLGPILFVLYTADLLQLVCRHHFRPHAYADDVQIYGSCRPSEAGSLSDRISTCVDEVASWMASNRLQLYPSKTEVLCARPLGVNTKSRLSRCASAPLQSCRSLPSGTSEFTSTLTSPSGPMSMPSSSRASRRCVKSAACVVVYHIMPC